MTRTLSLVAILTIASVSAASAASAGGMHRSGAPAAAPGGGLHRGGGHAVTTPGLRRSFGGTHGVHRHNRFPGTPWIAAVPYETPPADVSVNNQFVVQPPPARRVCR